jgi:hypothetical protein
MFTILPGFMGLPRLALPAEVEVEVEEELLGPEPIALFAIYFFAQFGVQVTC